MKHPICPWCGHKLPHLRQKFVADKAIRQVLKLARKPTTIHDLATRYAELTGSSYRSGRRAVERLVTYGQLSRVSQGIYQERKNNVR